MSYPVAYKSAAASYGAGIQSLRVAAPAVANVVENLGPFVRGLPVVAAFLFGFEATWQFLDWIDPREPGPLPEGFGTTAVVQQPVPAVPAGVVLPPNWSIDTAGNCTDPFISCHSRSVDGVYYRQGHLAIGSCTAFTLGTSGHAVPTALDDHALEVVKYSSCTFKGITNEYKYTGVKPAPSYPTYSAGSPAVPAVVAPFAVGARAGEMPEDGVRAPPAGWPWAWPKPVAGKPPALGIPDRVVGDGDSIVTEIPVAQAPPGARDVVTVTPGAIVRTRTDSIQEIKPAKDRKFYNPKIMVGLKILMNAATESRDLVTALWKALPDKCKRHYRGPRGGHRKAKPNEMIEDIKYCVHNSAAIMGDTRFEQYVKRALVELLANEMQDGLYGLAGQKYKSAVRNLYNLGLYNRPVGLQSGDRFRPRVGNVDALSKHDKQLHFKKMASDDVFHSASSRIIDAVW